MQKLAKLKRMSVHLEVESGFSVKDLRSAAFWNERVGVVGLQVVQAQANVFTGIKIPPKRARKKGAGKNG